MGQIIRLRWPGFRLRAFTTSYDDGRMEDFRLADLMRRFGVKGTFNVNSELFYGDDRPDPAEKPLHRRMRRGELLRFAEEYRETAEIACHAARHSNLVTLTGPQIVEEVVTDRANLEEALGRIIRGMAYPYGTVNDAVIRAVAACGVAYSRTTKATRAFDLPRDWLRLDPTCHHKDPALFELADAFLAKEEKYSLDPQLFYLWGHAYEFDDADNWDLIESFLEKMGGRDDVWYATNMEIYEYVQAFAGLVWSAKGTRVANPGQIPLWFKIFTGSKTPPQEIFLEPGATAEV